MCICRIVVTDDLMRAVVNNSAAVYDYMVDLDLSLSLVKKKKKSVQHPFMDCSFRCLQILISKFNQMTLMFLFDS